MMYIWELLIQAMQENISEENITFRHPKRYSPYMELNFENINTVEVQSVAEVNPYYRFHTIFKNYMPVENKDDEQMKAVLFDLIIHYLGNLDRYRGMNRREYFIRFIIKDIERGLLGESVKECFSLFSLKEKNIVGNNILRLYNTGEGVFLFRDSMKRLFQKAIIYANAKERNILIIYVKRKKTKEQEKKVQLLKNVFLPFKYELEIYWEFLFGIIGEEEFMHQGKMIIY